MKKSALILLLLSVPSVAVSDLRPGDSPPDLVGRNIAGQEVLLSEFAGRVVIVTFWAAWCVPCLEELPILEGIQEAAGSDRLVVVAINLEGDRSEFRRMAKAVRETPLIVTHDPRGQVSRQFGLQGIPYTALIGKSGRIEFIHQGFNDQLIETIVDEVNLLLSHSASLGVATTD